MSLGVSGSAQMGSGFAFPVKVEARVSAGAPGLSIVGLADKAVGEARERVVSALESRGLLSLQSTASRIVVSLSPADQKKSGSHLDLAIAVACLTAARTVPQGRGLAFLGELGLDGSILPCRGVLAMVEAARGGGAAEVIVPKSDAREAAAVPGIEARAAANVREVAAHLRGNSLLPLVPKTSLSGIGGGTSESYQTAMNQREALRGAEISVAGGHSFAMVGPPGTGKTTVARACAEIMPPLSEGEAVEVARVASLAGLPVQYPVMRPFRAPHHTATYAALVGGGQNLAPGEAARAHRGVLFLDELPEFDRRALDALREPLEEGVVRISRASGSAQFPARFTLVAAMNPCPCGFAGDERRECRCAPGVAARYRGKVSGPIADRIDVWSRVISPSAEEVLGARPKSTDGVTAARARVATAREAQARRAERLGLPTWTTNAEAPDRLIKASEFTEESQKRLAIAAARLGLSARGMVRAMRVARTIADLEASPQVLPEHVLEAVSYRDRRPE